MDRFWDLFEKNVVISGTLALALAGAVIYLAVTGQPVPDVLSLSLGSVMGYFFGAGKAKDAARVLRRRP